MTTRFKQLRAALLGTASMAGAFSFAADIAFTGGPSGSNCDLSLAVNWEGGSLPSASGEVGVVNVAAFGTSYYVSSAAALGGLRFDNAFSKVTLNGAGMLSLGAGGLTLAGTGGIELGAPMSVTAASTWDIGGGPLHCRAYVSGSADLTWSNWSVVQLYTAPGYGGKMTLTGKGASYIHVRQAAAWANKVVVTGNGGILFEFSGRVPFSTIFPGRSFTHSPWADISFAGGGTLVLEDGDTFTTSGNFTQLASGGLEVNGGACAAGAVFLMGGSGGTGTELTGAPAMAHLSGGSFSANQFNLGMRATTNRLFRQMGGTATACAYFIGGHENIRGGTLPVMEYRLEGGMMTDKSGGSQDRGLVMGGTIGGANNRTSPGVFTMTGGTANFANVRWGAKGGTWTWDGASTTPNGRAYGLLDLRGGSFAIPSGGFSLAPTWNAGAVSNATYDIRLSGGTVQNTGSSDMTLAVTIGKGDGPSTWNTGANNVLVTAPVDGDGTLRKTGSGTLRLTDARQFNGSVDVVEGTFEVMGLMEAPSSYVEGENLRIFTADSLAASLADGDEVTSWSDSTGTLSCQKPTSSEINSPDTYAVPTFKPNIANGHAGLYFNRGHVLGFHPADNPLAGETNFSFAIVFRPTAAGVASGGDAYAGRCIIGNDRAWSSQGRNNISLIHTSDSRVTLYLRNNQPNVGGLGRTYMVPAIEQGHSSGTDDTSVAIVSMSGNRIVYNFNNGFTNRTFETVSGNFNPRFMDGNTKCPLFFGTSDLDNTKKEEQRCFGGYIFEARFYKGCALTEAETRSLMDELTRKYHGAARADGYVRESNGPASASFADARAVPETRVALAEWSPEFMDTTFGAWDANYNKPEFIPAACNGRSALRFNAMRNTVLRIPAGTNQDPLAGRKQFAIAFVFRTTAEGTGLDDGSTGTGIYSSMLAGYGHNSGCANSAITFREYSTVGGYMATNEGGGSLINPRKPCRLNDGQPHVAVFSADSDTGLFRLMVDGVFAENTLGHGTTWAGYDSSRPHVIGALRAGVGHFTGDIMGFAFYDATLTETEMLSVCRKAAIDYGFNLKERRAFSLAEMVSRGISATNYTVAAGATLRMPLSAAAPLMLGAGATLSGDGTFEGSYRFGAGSVLDFSTLPANIEDVQVSDGATVRFPAVAAPVVAGNISSVSGSVTFDVSAVPGARSLPSIPLLAIDQRRIAPETVFQTVGARGDAEILYDDARGILMLRQSAATRIIVR